MSNSLFLNEQYQKRFGYIILFAPLIFIGHFLEEAPGFVFWFNSHVSRGINQQMFWSVNISALIITLFVVVVEFFSRSSFSLVLILLWFSFLMFANALLHLAGAIVDGVYVPGLITAVILYIPYYCWIVVRIVKSRRMRIGFMIIIALLGSLPMLIHGYKILFLGDRLF